MLLAVLGRVFVGRMLWQPPVLAVVGCSCVSVASPIEQVQTGLVLVQTSHINWSLRRFDRDD